MNRDHIADLREDYQRGTLLEQDAPRTPWPLFKRWFTEAEKAGLPEPNAMTLATASQSGQPSARVVLLKGLSPRGFVFYTNHQSRKGRDLSQNGHAALVFDWHAMERQVNIEGKVEKLSSRMTLKYFRSRPRGSQLGAWASRQSRPIASRELLEARLAMLEKKYSGQPIPLPPFWGGYRLVPRRIHFWQGRSNRLHDRMDYTRSGSTWKRSRLCP